MTMLQHFQGVSLYKSVPWHGQQSGNEPTVNELSKVNAIYFEVWSRQTIQNGDIHPIERKQWTKKSKPQVYIAIYHFHFLLLKHVLLPSFLELAIKCYPRRGQTAKEEMLITEKPVHNSVRGSWYVRATAWVFCDLPFNINVIMSWFWLYKG